MSTTTITTTTTTKPPFPSPTETWHTTTYPSLSPTRPILSAAGKTILITGGGTGIGAETARHFAAAGASRIALLGRREAPLLATQAALRDQYPGVEVFVASADVTKQHEVDAAFDQFLGGEGTGKGGLDVLVSGAAMTGPHGSVVEVDGEGFMGTVDVNLRGALYVAKGFLRYAVPGAVVVNISSSAAHINFGDKFAAYSTAKMAVVRMWDALAAAREDVRVYHIQPGVVDTDMNREVGGVKATGIEDHVSLPASFILWLASPEAQFLKGKFLWANWDVDELKARREELESTTQFNIVLGGWPFSDHGYKGATWNA